MARFLKITVAYDGTDFAGWQVQDNQRSVQQEFERIWAKVVDETIRVTASGRTDSGVHALGQVVGVETASPLPPDVLVRALNSNMPRDLIVLDVAEAPDGFHATYDCRGKRYRYLIQDGPISDVLQRRFAWFVPKRLDVEAMNQAASLLVGEHDFASFQTTGSPRATTVRTVSEARVGRGRGALPDAALFDTVVFEIAADGFLYNMVRSIVGTLVDIGRGALPPAAMTEILAARDRKAAGMTAPPQGLYLVSAEYDF